jgi:exo-beta-1,3-glucanase (GH17 family)
MGVASALFAIAAAAIVAVWGWLGSMVQMPPSPLASGGKLYCISYAPFRGDQSPFGPDVPIDPRQIDEDLAQLKQITDCVRTYSIDHGLDQIPEIAQRHGMKVLQGLWLSNRPDRSRYQIETAIGLAKRFPDVIVAVIVGNEVLLRGEMSGPELARIIREVKAQVSMPVTYADVWEFWLRHREVAAAVDFISIHILPYWEDFPIPAHDAPGHVDAIRRQMVAAFPDKDILVGEFGWPSAGRMREGALPSPVNQARVMHEVLAHARRENYQVNLIEAYDQPWKRQLEGTVGGHWGIYDAYRRQLKFVWGGAVSNHPHWRWQAAGGVGLATLVFGVALAARRGIGGAASATGWLRVAAMAIASGATIGWTIENVPLESLTLGDWLRSLAWTAVALMAPLVSAAALASGARPPIFAQILARAEQRPRRAVPLSLGLILLVTVVLSAQAALGLVFDGRYRDFPFAPLTAAAVPLLVLGTWKRRSNVPAAEKAMAATLAVSAVYIVGNESFANWQALWFAAALLALALTLVQARDVPG